MSILLERSETELVSHAKRLSRTERPGTEEDQVTLAGSSYIGQVSAPMTFFKSKQF